jgi:two-component system, chemotaxis family, chemotaxis protein CheY
MRVLVVEDDFTSRLILQEILKDHGTVHIVVNGREALEAVRAAMLTGELYDLICMDIMMPEIDGQTALKQIREMERKAGICDPNCVKIVMTTALGDKDNVMDAIREHCDGYMIKPYNKATLLDHLRKFALIK